MTVQLSSLRVFADMDATRYVAGMKQKVAADKAAVASGREVGQTVTATETRLSASGTVASKLARQYVDGYASAQRFSGAIGALARAIDTGNVTMAQAETILEGIYRKYGLVANATELAQAGHTSLASSVTILNARLERQQSAALGTAAAMTQMAAANDNLVFRSRQLSFQLVDIGQALVTLPTMGIYAVQNLGFQVAQIGQLYAGQGGLLAALKDSISLVGTFLVRYLPLIGAVTAGAAAWALYRRNVDEASASTRALASEAASLGAVQSQISELQGITDAYARAIRDTAKDQTISSNSIIADSRREFEAKKSLLELELKRQQALIDVNRMALSQRQGAFRTSAAAATATIDLDGGAQGTYDPRVGQVARSRAQSEAVSAVLRLTDSAAADELKRLRAELDLSEVAANRLNDALKVTFDESVGISQGRIAKTGRKGTSDAEKAAKRYQAILRDQKQYIDGLQQEAAALGLSERATRAAAIETELLNKAQDAGIKLTAAQRAELHGLAEASATAEFGLAKARAELDALREAGAATGSILKGLADGTLDWKDALSQAVSVALRLLNTINVAGGGRGIFGGGFFQSLLGGLLGIPFADGGVLRHGTVVPFARGGVVDRPTLFPMARGAGLMGEAGPEAVVPLRRGRDGRLGIEAHGGDHGASRTYAPVYNIDARGADAGAVARIEGALKSLDRNFDVRVLSANRAQQVRRLTPRAS